MARQKKGKMYKKKLRVQKGQIIDEETISVTASVTNGGHSKEGMKGIIFGLSKEKRLLLEHASIYPIRLDYGKKDEKYDVRQFEQELLRICKASEDEAIKALGYEIGFILIH